MHQGSVLQNGVHQLYKKPDWGGRCSDGFIATGVMEIIYEDKLQGEGD